MGGPSWQYWWIPVNAGVGSTLVDGGLEENREYAGYRDKMVEWRIWMSNHDQFAFLQAADH